MPTINELQDEIIEEFSALDDWMDRYALIIDLGNTLEPLPESDKTPTNIIEGCQSRVWITASYSDGKVHFRGESDAIIVKGIVSLLLRVLDGQTPEDILASDLYFIKEIGLSEHLSPTRSVRCASLPQPSQVRLSPIRFILYLCSYPSSSPQAQHFSSELQSLVRALLAPPKPL